MILEAVRDLTSHIGLLAGGVVGLVVIGMVARWLTREITRIGDGVADLAITVRAVARRQDGLQAQIDGVAETVAYLGRVKGDT